MILGLIRARFSFILCKAKSVIGIIRIKYLVDILSGSPAAAFPQKPQKLAQIGILSVLDLPQMLHS